MYNLVIYMYAYMYIWNRGKHDNLIEGHSTINFFDLHQNVYSEVASKKARKAIASKYIISYQNKDFNKSNDCKVILSHIRLQRQNLDKSLLVDIFTNNILE